MDGPVHGKCFNVSQMVIGATDVKHTIIIVSSSNDIINRRRLHWTAKGQFDTGNSISAIVLFPVYVI